MFVKPIPGIKIRHPFLKTFIPEEGMEVEENGFWLRRVRDGDVTVGAPENQVAKRKAKGSS